MKIALVGNMNNNNFAIMRYFRDLGADAHLLLWADDGRGPLEHFVPENDTWDIDRWRPYIHETGVENSVVTLLGDLRKLRRPATRRGLFRRLGGYDAYVGSGYAPAILARAGIRMDIFYPYGVGIENVGALVVKKYFETRSAPKRFVMRRVRAYQMAAIRNARHCVCADLCSLTRAAFDEIGAVPVPLAVPMVYNREAPPRGEASGRLAKIMAGLGKYDLKILSHARQFWVREAGYSPEEWKSRCKYSDWLIHGFAQALKRSRAGKALLMLVEYGKDVPATKALIAELGIGDHVRWLPKMNRKEILALLSHCDAGVGQFGVDPGMIWGGTGWEVLAAGRPLLQTVNFTNEEFRRTFGSELPPILDVRSPEDVARHVEDLALRREVSADIGRRSQEWFNAHNGIGLAKKWLELIHEPR